MFHHSLMSEIFVVGAGLAFRVTAARWLEPVSEREDQNSENEVCQSDDIQDQIRLMVETLGTNDSDVLIQTQRNLSDETILVLDMTGSETSLVRSLTENTNVLSRKVDPNTEKYLTAEGENIRITANHSSRRYSKIINYNSTITFIDTPVFQDSRSSADEMISIAVMKKITNRTKKAKVLLLMNYNLDAGYFLDTMRRLINSLVDIDKIRDHIALIVTTDEIESEEIEIESIVDYLNKLEYSIGYLLKLERVKDKIANNLYKQMIRLLQRLQTRDTDRKPSRVNILLNPYKLGASKNMTLLEDNRKSLFKTINNLEPVEIGRPDFNFKLSNAADSFRKCLLKCTVDRINDEFDNIRNSSLNFFEFLISIIQLNLMLEKVEVMASNIEETDYFENVFRQFGGFNRNPQDKVA